MLQSIAVSQAKFQVRCVYPVDLGLKVLSKLFLVFVFTVLGQAEGWRLRYQHYSHVPDVVALQALAKRPVTPANVTKPTHLTSKIQHSDVRNPCTT